MIDSLARVSTLTGASALSLSSATHLARILGREVERSTVPTAMPLYCTALPSVRPVTGSVKITAYCCQFFSDEYFAAHNPNSSNSTAVSRVNAPIRT